MGANHSHTAEEARNIFDKLDKGTPPHASSRARSCSRSRREMCAEGVGEVSLRDLLASNEPNLEWAKSPMFLFRVRATTSLLLLLLVLPLLLMLPLLPPPSPHLHLQLVQAAERNDSARAWRRAVRSAC